MLTSSMAFYQDFSWAVAPMSSIGFAGGAVVAYLTSVCVLMAHMGARSEAYQVPDKLVAAHNIFLSLASTVMFLGCLYEFTNEYLRQKSLFWYFCDTVDPRETGSSGPLFFWSYVYYLSKFYELLDTMFVLLRKSRIPHFTLQVYHHAAVIPMCWLWLETRQSLQFFGLLFNTLVHIVMYYYYALQVLGIKNIWWKKYITKLQIVQFSVSFLCFIGSCYIVASPESCNGFHAKTYYSIWYNVVFNATLLYAFVGVAKTNSRKANAAKGK